MNCKIDKGSNLALKEGLVYAVEFSHRSGRDLINVAKKRTNIIPIIEDARHPHKYRMLVTNATINILNVVIRCDTFNFFIDWYGRHYFR